MKMIVERLYTSKLQDYLQHKKDEDTLYVTDLVRCPLKVRFEEQYKELAMSEVFAPSMLLGDLVHSGLEDFLKREFNAEVEVEVEKEIPVNGKTVKIKGRADAIIQQNNERIVVEIKSAKGDKGLPLEHHKAQLQLYLWLFNVRKGILIYVTPDRVTEYIIDQPADEVGVIRLTEETLRASKAPRYQWECKYCVFKVICPNRKS
jgi:CRISPR-associated exonuclease Cas4